MRPIQFGDQLFGCDGSESVLADRGQLAPVHVTIPSDPDPATPAHVRWSEEPVGFCRDELVLGSWWGSAPHVWEVVVVVAAGPQHHELLAGEEARNSMASTLRHSGKGQAYGPDTVH